MNKIINKHLTSFKKQTLSYRKILLFINNLTKINFILKMGGGIIHQKNKGTTMNGKILSITQEGGLIKGEDSKRYPFEISEYKEEKEPTKGQIVDFEIDENGNAVEIYDEDIVLENIKEELDEEVKIPEEKEEQKTDFKQEETASIPTQNISDTETIKQTNSAQPILNKDVNIAAEAFKIYIDAIKNNYNNFEGTVTRREFWLFTAIDTFLVFALAFILPLLGLYIIATFIPRIAITVRRIHDMGQSGWLFLLSFVPYIGPFLVMGLALFPSKLENNPYRED